MNVKETVIWMFTIDIPNSVIVTMVMTIVMIVLSICHIQQSLNERKEFSKPILTISVIVFMIAGITLDLLLMTVVILRPDRKLLDFWEDDSIINRLIPILWADYKFTKVRNPSKEAQAERRLSGLCLECGEGQRDTRRGHHHLCRTANNTGWTMV